MATEFTFRKKFRELMLNGGVNPETKYATELANVWWEWFGKFPDDEFEAAIDRLLDQGVMRSKMPQKSDMWGALRSVGSLKANAPRAAINCDMCDGSGLITAVRSDDNEFVFRCPCPVGGGGTGKIPVWGPDVRERGYRLKFDEDNIKNKKEVPF